MRSFCASLPTGLSDTGRTGPGGTARTPFQSSRALRATTIVRRIPAEADPPVTALSHARRARTRARHPPYSGRQVAVRRYSERCCGMPASSARTSVSR
jgi:hypothetical protein